jgi:hypothetical protein
MLWGALFMAAVLILALWRGPATARPLLQIPPSPEPLVPTAQPAYRPTATRQLSANLSPTVVLTPTPQSTVTATSTIPSTLVESQATAMPEAPTPEPTGTPAERPLVPPSARARVGVGLPLDRNIDDYSWGNGLPGWWLGWRVMENPPRPADIRFVQVVHTVGDSVQQGLERIPEAARANPGSLWLIGNEPDVAWQGDATPEEYAAIYGRLYPVIKAADPSAQVAIGGVSQPTPLRIQYIERILAAYEAQFGEPMPIDVWNIRAFILREEADSWGVGIPSGMDGSQGQLYEITDHTDMTIFRQQIVDFRRWMAQKGFRDKPLLVSEYGVLMPESYGFPPEVVSKFMLDSFDYFLTAYDPEIGNPADDNRLVQAFCWYSAADTNYPTPNLFNPETRRATPLGEIFQAYVAGLP